MRFDELDCDSKELAAVFSFLDRTDITAKLLQRACTNKAIWGSDGNIHFQKSDLRPVLTEPSRTDAAVQCLEKAGFIVKTGELSFSVAEKLRREVLKLPGLDAWKLEAIKAVLHTFPEHRHLDPL